MKKILSRIQKGRAVGMHSGEDVPKSIDIHAAVIAGSDFRPKWWMVVLSYSVAAIIIICIGVGAYSFIKASKIISCSLGICYYKLGRFMIE